jgi:hypothetical protein
MIIGAVVGSISLSSIYFSQVAFHQNEEHRSFWVSFLSGAAIGAFLGHFLVKVKDEKEVDVTGPQIASDPSVAQRLTAAHPTDDLLSISKEATLSVNSDNNPSSSVKPAEKEILLSGVQRNVAVSAVICAFFGTLFCGTFFFYLSAFGYEKSTLDGITVRYPKPLDLLCGLAFAALPFAAVYSLFHFSLLFRNLHINWFTTLLITIMTIFGITVAMGVVGMVSFFKDHCNWIRVDSDEVATGFFYKKSVRFEQIREVEFTEVRTEYKAKAGHIKYDYSPTAEFTTSSGKVTWPGYPMIYVEQEFQQMLKLKEIPYSTRRSRSYSLWFIAPSD